MEINGAVGAATYLNLQNTTPAAGSQQQNQPQPQPAQGTENTNQNQPAYQVNLSQEARGTLATQTPQEQPPPPPEQTPPVETTGMTQLQSRFGPSIDVVA